MEITGTYGDICSSTWTASDNGLINESFLDNFILDEETQKEDIMLIIRDREAGNVIEHFNTLEEAEKKLAEYEEQDKRDNIYVKDFYEIVRKEDL